MNSSPTGKEVTSKNEEIENSTRKTASAHFEKSEKNSPQSPRGRTSKKKRKWRRKKTFWAKLPRLKRCCFCIRLRAATLVIGISGIGYGLIGLFGLFFMTTMSILDHNYLDNVGLINYLYFLFVLISSVILFSALLLTGVLNHKHRLIIVYLWYCIIHLILFWVLHIGYNIYCICKECAPPEILWPYCVLSLLLLILYTIMWLYILLICNSYRMEVIILNLFLLDLIFYKPDFKLLLKIP